MRKSVVIRFNILFLIIFFLFTSLLFRLSVIQLVEGDSYRKQINTITTRKIPLISLRGSIYDRNGNVLAKDRASFTLIYQEGELKKEKTIPLAIEMSKVIQMEAEIIIRNMDVGYDLSGKRVPRREQKFFPKKIKAELTEKEIAYLAEHRSDFPGFEVVVEAVRIYDPSSVAAQTIGYLKPYGVAKTLPAINKRYQLKDQQYLPWEQVGIDGVELQYEEILKGINGYREVVVDATEQALNTVNEVPPVPGNSLYLTIDKDIQLLLEDAIDQHLQWLRSSEAGERQSPNAKTAYAVAMEVKTGKIVAMASYPDYDPNIWQLGPNDTRTWEGIGYRMINGTIRSTMWDPTPLPPEESQKHPASIVYMGSTVKPLTVLMALNEGIISVNDRWQDPGVYIYGTYATDRVRNSGNNNYGILTPQKAIQKSSNTYMARIGHQMAQRLENPVNIFQTYQHRFGLGVKTGIELPFESVGVEDYIFAANRYSPKAALVLASFGQQQKYTALQLTQYTATIANNGYRIRPMIVDRIVDQAGRLVKEFTPEVLNVVDISQQYFDVIQEGMLMVTQPGGTAYSPFADFPYPVAAKTGTSEQEIYVPKDPKDFSKGFYKDRVVENAVFISYAPANRPKLAVVVVVPEGGYGSVGGAPIARKVYEAYDQKYGLDTVNSIEF